MTSDFLATMAAASRDRWQAAQATRPLAVVREAALASPAPPPLRLNEDGFDIIAEIKLTSPAAGELAAGDTPIGPRAEAYARAGAAAVSVLTEPSRFDGNLNHLVEAAAALEGTTTVAMRKDFLVHAYQIYEARLAGAGGVLLIVRMLEDAQLNDMLDAAAQCGLFVLLEAFDENDLRRARDLLSSRSDAAPAAPVLVGLNSRDLRSLAVDVDRFARCRRHFPEGVPAVAESGLESIDDVVAVAGQHYHLALIGSALMRHEDPPELLSAMLAAARRMVRASRDSKGKPDEPPVSALP